MIITKEERIKDLLLNIEIIKFQLRGKVRKSLKESIELKLDEIKLFLKGVKLWKRLQQ